MKRFFSLVMAVCMILAFCLPAGALSFTDKEKIHNLDAVTIMADLGLVNGYEDGSFWPRNNIRRAEAAKLAALICEADPKTTSAVAFSDVAGDSWAAGFVAYCAEKGIIAGSGGNFRPNDYVTGRELAKMLLICLGYEGGDYVGPDWADNVDADAEALGIYAGFTADPVAYISRDDACLLMYNAMQCFAVTGKDAEGREIYALDQLMNPITYMEYRFGVKKFSGILEANEFADLTAPGGRLEEGLSRLRSHAAFRVSTPYSYLGRTVEFYAVHTTVKTENFYTVIGIPHLTKGKEAFTAQGEESYLLALRYAGITADEATEYYLNGDRAESDFMARLGADCTITAVDHDGDMHMDMVLAATYEQGTVTELAPLTVSCGGTELPGGFLDSPRDMQLGDTVRCTAAGGVYWID